MAIKASSGRREALMAGQEWAAIGDYLGNTSFHQPKKTPITVQCTNTCRFDTTCAASSEKEICFANKRFLGSSSGGGGVL